MRACIYFVCSTIDAVSISIISLLRVYRASIFNFVISPLNFFLPRRLNNGQGFLFKSLGFGFFYSLTYVALNYR